MNDSDTLSWRLMISSFYSWILSLSDTMRDYLQVYLKLWHHQFFMVVSMPAHNSNFRLGILPNTMFVYTYSYFNIISYISIKIIACPLWWLAYLLFASAFYLFYFDGVIFYFVPSEHEFEVIPFCDHYKKTLQNCSHQYFQCICIYICCNQFLS